MSELSVADNLTNLEFVKPGQTLELQTIRAGLLEIVARLSGADTLIFTPSETVYFTRDETRDDPMTPAQKAEFHATRGRLLTRLDQCRFVAAALHQPGHYTAWVAVRASLGEQWTYMQSDSTHPPLKDTVQCGQRFALALALPAPTLSSPTPRQRDGWT